MAIKTTAEFIHQHSIMKSIIFSTIQALNEPKDLNCELLFGNIHKFVKAIVNNRDIKVIWLKLHFDIEGNTKVDYVATCGKGYEYCHKN